MNWRGFAIAMESIFLGYFVLLTLGYLIQNLIAMRGLAQHVERREGDSVPWLHTGFEPPVTIIVPAYNEEAVIATSIRSLLALEYPEFEVLAVNDGSSDRTLRVLEEEFGLRAFPEAIRLSLPTQPVRAVYRTPEFPELRVIDKVNGGKADAINVGLNVARHPIVVIMDSDSFLQRDSLLRIVRPFLERPETIATGGTVRIANGCTASEGNLTEVRMPPTLLPGFQVVEYLRAFLFGRMGWIPLNALLIISGAFGAFRRTALLDAGGFNPETVGEDMEVTVRLHRCMLLERDEEYRIDFVPDPVCWTEAPESLRVLGSQRARWQRGLTEALAAHRALLLHPNAGPVGWLAYPFFITFEWLGPIVEGVGYLYLVLGLVFGFVSLESFAILLLSSVLLGVLLSTSALFLEEFAFHMYPRARDVLRLMWLAVLENFGYRQLTTFWRLHGLFVWMSGRKAEWGTMTRTATWTSAPPPSVDLPDRP